MRNEKDIIKLSNGVRMPDMGIGTNWMKYKELKAVMEAGFSAGFRAIDTARDYGNEPVVGQVFHDILKESGGKYRREDFFLTTKIGNGQQIRGKLGEEIDRSLKNLKTDYIDLWLMHWPYPGYYERTWHEMEKVYESGKVRAIGVANYDVRHFERLLSSGVGTVPMVNQFEYHPLRTAGNLVGYMRSKGIRIQSYAPLCRLVTPLRESQFLKDLCQKYNKSLGQIILRWHVQQGDDMPVFKSYKPSRFSENMNVFDFSLTEDEMDFISSLNMDYKYHIESVNCPGY